jgi:hypothetical protein
MTLTDVTMIVHKEPVPIGALRAGMAAFVNGEWHHVTSALWDDEGGRWRLLFAPGTGALGADFTPDETVWAYPDWQRMADLAMTPPETAGPADDDSVLEGSEGGE